MSQNLKNKLFYIFTFGIGYLLAKRKAVQITKSQKDNLIGTTDDNFNIDNFILVLGGINNIISVTPTISSLKVTCKNTNQIIQKDLKNFKIKGYVVSKNSITLLLGDISYDIANKIKTILEKNN